MDGDREFEAWFAARVAEVAGVRAVALGGSRSRGEERPDSDWDFALYYRGGFDLEGLRAQGWGELSDVGAWPGVMNGGGWLEVRGRRVDLHYRDLDDVDRRWEEARRGEFEVQRIPFYLAGMPTYLPLAELAVCTVCVGELPRPPEFPARLREEAQRRWHEAAGWSLRYALRSLRQRGDTVLAAGNLARGLIEEAHSRLSGRGVWVVNEKNIVPRAGLGEAAELMGASGLTVAALQEALIAVSRLVDVEQPD